MELTVILPTETEMGDVKNHEKVLDPHSVREIQALTLQS